MNITLIDPIPPVQYLWSNGDTTEDLSGVASGIYWVHATDASGKMYADTFVVDGIDISIFTTMMQPD
ncbi:MAG: hypothetical protein KDD63_26810, partial [Bacteroidetes bacterium]|nr:hypothetical protein [Bacteroidota bacterium]